LIIKDAKFDQDFCWKEEERPQLLNRVRRDFSFLIVESNGVIWWPAQLNVPEKDDQTVDKKKR
jgi:hypothetical protein